MISTSSKGEKDYRIGSHSGRLSTGSGFILESSPFLPRRFEHKTQACPAAFLAQICHDQTASEKATRPDARERCAKSGVFFISRTRSQHHGFRPLHPGLSKWSHVEVLVVVF